MDILKPDFDLFKKKYKLGKRQILYTSLAADVHTPVSSLIKLEKENYTFLFESVEKGSQKGRYSVIGLKPDLIWECKNNNCRVTDKTLKKNYYDLRSKKVNNLIKSLNKRSFKKLTLGGCIFIKKIF